MKRVEWDEREISARFDDLELSVRGLVGARASISSSRGLDRNGIIADLNLESRGEGGCPAYVVALSELVVGLGENSRLELDYSDNNFELVKQILAAVVAGRVTETFGLRRSRVVITFGDGKTLSSTGFNGCSTSMVPQPGWRRWGRRLHYAPYL